MRLFGCAVACATVLLVCSTVGSAQPVGDEFLVSAPGTASQSDPDVAAAPDGSFVVTWTVEAGSATSSVVARRLGPDGQPLTGEIPVSAPGAPASDARLAAHADGSFVVVWHVRNDATFCSEAYLRRFDAGGVPLGAEAAVATDAGCRTKPVVGVDGSGRTFVAWTQADTSSSTESSIRLRRHEADGTAAEPVVVNGPLARHRMEPRLAANAAGAVVVSWDEVQPQGGSEIRAQLFDSAGAPATEILVSDAPSNFGQSWVAIAEDGAIVVARTSDGAFSVYAHRYAPDGSLRGTTVLNQTGSYNRWPSLAMLPGGGFLAAWEGGTSYDLQARVFGPQDNGSGCAPASGQFRLNNYTPDFQVQQALAVSPEGNAIAVWQSTGQTVPGQPTLVARLLRTTATVAISSIEVAETEAFARVPYTLSEPLPFPVTVSVFAQSGPTDSASGHFFLAPGFDYVQGTSSVTLPAGATAGVSLVTLQDDLRNEADETFTVSVINCPVVPVAPSSVKVTILDDDLGPVLESVTGPVVSESQPSARFTVNLSGNVQGGDTMIQVETVAGTATPGDFLPRSTSIVIPRGQLVGTVDVTLFQDLVYEQDETFQLRVSCSSCENAETVLYATATIADDDPRPEVASATGSTVSEMAASATVTVTLTGASKTPFTLNYSTVADTATAGQDFVATTGTVAVPAGDTAVSFGVPLVGDAIDEPTEQFYVDVTCAGCASVRRATVTLNDDDPAPSLLPIAQVVVGEGAGTAQFRITLSEESAFPLSVSWSTSPGTATAADYTEASGSATIPAGSRTLDVDVSVRQDALFEPVESFSFTATCASCSSPTAWSATGTITDDDPRPEVASATGVTVSEAAGTATVTATLSSASASPFTLSYQTAAGTATPGFDYAHVMETVDVPAGSTSVSFLVPLTDDAMDEPAEQFYVDVTCTGCSGVQRATVGLTDDDPRPELASVAGVVVSEAAGTATVVATLSSASASPFTLNYQTVGGSAEPGFDYTHVMGTVDVPAGSTSVSIVVPLVDDTIDEGDERLYVDVTCTGCASSQRAIVELTDDDPLPAGAAVLYITDAVLGEPRHGSTLAVLTVSLSKPATQVVVMEFVTMNGSAQAGFDFTAVAGTLTFAAGERWKTISVPVNSDNDPEGQETFGVEINNLFGAQAGDLSATVTIKKNK